MNKYQKSETNSSPNNIYVDFQLTSQKYKHYVAAFNCKGLSLQLGTIVVRIVAYIFN